MALDRLYRPGVIMRIYIRLEDFSENTDPTAVTEELAFRAQLSELLQQQAEVSRQLSEARAAAASGERSPPASLLQRDRKLAQQIATLQSRAQGDVPLSSEQLSDPFSVEVVTVPTDFALELNSFRIADTIKASIPYRDAPLDNQIIRAALVEVFEGLIPAEDFATSDRWQLPLGRENLVFRGYVDEWEDSHGEDDTIAISARSMEAVLIDTKMNPAGLPKVSKSGERLTSWINRFLATIPAVSGIAGGDKLVAILDPRIDPGQEPNVDTKLLLRCLQTAKSQNKANGSVNGQAPNVDAEPADPGSTEPGFEQGTGEARMPLPSVAPGQVSAWDIIVAACELVGLIPVFDPTIKDQSGNFLPDSIVVRAPQTAMPDVNNGVTVPGGPPDNFRRSITNADGSSTSTEVRFMIWGHNIKSIRKGRKLGRTKSPTVEVIAHVEGASPSSRTLRARFPLAKAKRATRVGAKGGGKQEEVVVRVLKGIRSQEQLQQAAVSIYNQIARQETVVTIETDDLSSFLDPAAPLRPEDDLLRLRSGAPVRVLVAEQSTDPSRGLVVNQFSEIYGKRGDALRNFLERQVDKYVTVLNLDDIARMRRAYDAISDAFESARLSDVFYCRTARHQWNIDDGLAMTFELVNYMIVRGEPAGMGSDTRDANDDRKRFKPGEPAQRPLRDDTQRIVDRVLDPRGL